MNTTSISGNIKDIILFMEDYMNFYDLTYLEKQATVNDYFRNFLIAFAVLFLVIIVGLYILRRLERKYRDLGIIVALFLVFMLGIQYTDYTQFQSQSNQSSQMINFIKQVAAENKVSTRAIQVSSTQLTDGIIVKINHKFYQTRLNADQNSYLLTQTHILAKPIFVK